MIVLLVVLKSSFLFISVGSVIPVLVVPVWVITVFRSFRVRFLMICKFLQ